MILIKKVVGDEKVREGERLEKQWRDENVRDGERLEKCKYEVKKYYK